LTSSNETGSDLLSGKAKSQPDRLIERSIEAPHSPLQITANRTLLSIAGKGSEGFTGKIGSESRTESPKPAFLRRLDSPLTNHGRLLQHKSTLDKIVRRAKRAVPHVQLEQYQKIHASLLEAVEFLEQSTTTSVPKKEGD